MGEGVRVMLVDDHPVVRAGLGRLLEAAGERVVAEANDGEEAYRLYGELAPDVVVLDLSLPGMSGLETARRLLTRYGEAHILVVSIHDNPAMLARALKAGVIGYLSKQIAPSTLLDAVRAVARGEMYIDPALAEAAPGAAGDLLERLTPREFEVFRLLGEGHAVGDIATLLHISPKTVGVHQTRILRKLNIGNSAQLALLAVRCGVVRP